MSGVGISYSSTGLQSVTKGSLVRADSAGAKRAFAIFCTTRADSWCALRARFTARGAPLKSSCSFSLAQTEVLQVKIGGGAQKTASFDAVGARTPCRMFSLPLVPNGWGSVTERAR
eukprot:5279071-Pleurochrysis_carterae.AAC.5